MNDLTKILEMDACSWYHYYQRRIKGDPNTKKIGVFNGIKLTIFVGESADNFEKQIFKKLGA